MMSNRSHSLCKDEIQYVLRHHDELPEPLEAIIFFFPRPDISVNIQSLHFIMHVGSTCGWAASKKVVHLLQELIQKVPLTFTLHYNHLVLCCGTKVTMSQRN